MLATLSKPRIALSVLYALSFTVPAVWCDPHNNNNNNNDKGGDDSKGFNPLNHQSPQDWFDALARKGKEALRNSSSLLDDKEDLTTKASVMINEYFASGAPGKISYGFLMGYSSGFFVKKASRAVAFAVGGVFALIQALAYNGYVIVNHEKMKTDVEKILDQNNDGIIDSKDFTILFDKVKNILSYNMPTGGGFVAGLLVGLRP